MDHVNTILWEDLDNARTRVQRILTALQSLQYAIQTGQIGQPTRAIFRCRSRSSFNPSRIKRIAMIGTVIASRTWDPSNTR